MLTNRVITNEPERLEAPFAPKAAYSNYVFAQEYETAETLGRPDGA